jgi:hypothetical protein
LCALLIFTKTSQQENVKVPTAKPYANDFLSGPSAQVPNRSGREEGHRHKEDVGTEKLVSTCTIGTGPLP